MIQKKSTFDTILDYTILGVLVLLSISLIFSTYKSQTSLENIRQTYLEIDGEVQSAIRSVDSYFELKSQNDSLRHELERVSFDRQKYIASYFDLLDLKRTVNIRPSDSLSYIYAEVVGRNLNELTQTYTLNRGLKDSVRVNDPVIYKASLVGRVVSVSKNYSTVQLASDHLFEASVRVMRLGEVGTAKWNGTDHFDLQYIAKNIPILLGDVVITSGLSDIFPKHIRLGVIDKIETDISGLFHRVTVKPDIRFNDLRYVSVIKRHKIATYEADFKAVHE